MTKATVAIQSLLLALAVGCGPAARPVAPVHSPAPDVAEEQDATEGHPVSEAPSRACPAGLAAWWRFEEREGPVIDECGRHPGTAVGEGLQRGVPGARGGALAFDGTDGYVIVEGAPSLDFVTAGTIESWLRIPAPVLEVTEVHTRGPPHRPSGSWPVGSIVSRGTGNRDDNVLQNTSCGNLQTTFSRADGSGSTNVTSDCHLLPADEWAHVAVVHDGHGIRLYLNGRLVRETRGGHLGPVDADLIIGQRSQVNFPLTGAIDELRWWTIARTPEEICEAAGDRCVSPAAD